LITVVVAPAAHAQLAAAIIDAIRSNPEIRVLTENEWTSLAEKPATYE
jgi:hypothetical protein